FGCLGRPREPRFNSFLAQPAGQQVDTLRIEARTFTEGRHPVVALAIETIVSWVSDERIEPFERAPAGQIGSGGVFVLFAELMAFDTAERLRVEECLAFFNEGGVALVGFGLVRELAFGGNGRNYLAEGRFLVGREAGYGSFDVADHFAVFEFCAP